jgi:hypothetical protein
VLASLSQRSFFALLVPLQRQLLRQELIADRDVRAAMAAQRRFGSFFAHHADVAGDTVVRPDAVSGPALAADDDEPLVVLDGPALLLETLDVGARMEKVSRLLAQRIEVLRLSAEIGRQTKAALDERQREVLLREQMAAIQRRAS